MTPPHFILKHTLLAPEGKIIGEKTFTAADPKAESTYDLPAGFKGMTVGLGRTPIRYEVKRSIRRS
jgi:hypothetical protein